MTGSQQSERAIGSSSVVELGVPIVDGRISFEQFVSAVATLSELPPEGEKSHE